jgi:hypothetical protein
MLRELATFIGESDDPDAAGTYAMTSVLIRLPPRESPRDLRRAT